MKFKKDNKKQEFLALSTKARLFLITKILLESLKERIIELIENLPF
jgi:hypothetical protein